KGVQVASIGPITSKTALDHGVKIDVEARSHDIDGLVQAIRDFFERWWLFYRPGDGINRLYLRQRATFRVFEFWNPLSTNPKSLGWIKAEPRSTTLGVGFGFAAALLVRRFKRAQTPDFLENTLRIQLAFEPLQRAIDGFTLTNDHFWHR